MPTPDDQATSMLANLPEKTGRSLDEWRKHLTGTGLEKHGQIVAHLKKEHGVTHGFANLIAHKFLKSDAGSADAADLVAAQYEGKKAGVRPIYDALMARVTAFGPDVEIAPKKSYVSLRRSKQFALFQPTTTRLDVGIKLSDTEPAGRLEASGSFNAMVSHRVRVGAVDEVDAELEGWLRQAYDEA